MAPKKDAAPKAGPKEPEKPVTPPEPTEGIGKFYYPTGATYEGGWKLVPETPSVGADVVAGKGNIAAAGKAPAAKPTTAKGAAEPPAAVIAATPPEKKRPNRQRNGKGLYIEGDYQYEGDWLDDKIHGTGCFKYASGASYDGQWENDQYMGVGVYKWPNGAMYSGEWRENKMHGNGTYVDKEGNTWVGQFFNGTGPGLVCEIV
ncbi:unnamed protein product [Sphagnum compactum]